MTSSLCSCNPSVKLNPDNLQCRLIAFDKFHTKYKFENHVTRNDVIMMSLGKQWKNADLREISQIIYRLKGLDESYPKMEVLSNLSNFVSFGSYSSRGIAQVVKFNTRTLHHTFARVVIPFWYLSS